MTNDNNVVGCLWIMVHDNWRVDATICMYDMRLLSFDIDSLAWLHSRLSCSSLKMEAAMKYEPPKIASSEDAERQSENGTTYKPCLRQTVFITITGSSIQTSTP